MNARTKNRLWLAGLLLFAAFLAAGTARFVVTHPPGGPLPATRLP